MKIVMSSRKYGFHIIHNEQTDEYHMVCVNGNVWNISANTVARYGILFST